MSLRGFQPWAFLSIYQVIPKDLEEEMMLFDGIKRIIIGK